MFYHLIIHNVIPMKRKDFTVQISLSSFLFLFVELKDEVPSFLHHVYIAVLFKLLCCSGHRFLLM